MKANQNTALLVYAGRKLRFPNATQGGYGPKHTPNECKNHA